MKDDTLIMCLIAIGTTVFCGVAWMFVLWGSINLMEWLGLL